MDLRPNSRPALYQLFGWMLALVGIGVMATADAHAQTYSCFPTCSSTDGRMLTIAGQGFSTIINESTVLKLAAEAGESNIEFGVFDGETGGNWDFGTTQLIYTLYADPDGDGNGDVQLWQRTGSDMLDNAWQSFTLANAAAARAPNGNYLYTLVVRTSDSTAHYWSSFKVRTNTGTVALKAQAFTIAASARTLQDFQTLYPNIDFTSPTFTESMLANAVSTYDGSWNLFLDVDRRGQMLDIWDGDLDFGDYACTVFDTDDPNTPNNTLPPWADPSVVRYEGVAIGSPCIGASDTGTGTPPDDNLRLAFRREPSIWYRVIDPLSNAYHNSNPSGDKEWELFRLGTSSVAAATRDVLVDSLPSGIYTVNINGMDVQNLNGWRFFFDALGVDANGNPTPPLKPYSLSGVVCSIQTVTTTTSSSTGNNRRGNGNGNGRSGSSTTTTTTTDVCADGLANVRVVVEADYNNDNVIDEYFVRQTNSSGEYRIDNLQAGTFRVVVDASTLPQGATPTSDYDGVSTPNQAVVRIVDSNPGNVFFRYDVRGGSGECVAIRSQGYWKNHEEAWPVSTLTLGATSYTKSQLLRIMNTPSRGDKSIDLAVQLIAAKLNVANNGCGSDCIATTIAEADAWLRTNGGVGSEVYGRHRVWRFEGEEIKDALDAFNNGRGCSADLD